MNESNLHNLQYAMDSYGKRATLWEIKKRLQNAIVRCFYLIKKNYIFLNLYSFLYLPFFLLYCYCVVVPSSVLAVAPRESSTVHVT